MTKRKSKEFSFNLAHIDGKQKEQYAKMCQHLQIYLLKIYFKEELFHLARI